MPDLMPPALPSGSLARLTQPVLRGHGLELRPWVERDAEAVAVAHQDPGVQRWHVRTMDLAEATAWIAHWPSRWHDETGAGWAVTDGAELLGQVAFRRVRLHEASVELSYWVLPAARGRGVATSALGLVTGWGMQTLGLSRLELCHSTLNPASCRVAVKAGFEPEGTFRRQGLHADGWHDMHWHARLAPGRIGPSAPS